MSQLGTLTWAAHTRGRMTGREKMGYLFQLIQAKLLIMLRRSGADPKKLAQVDLDGLKAPDSALARQAEEHCRDLSSEDLYRHCARAWCWGSLLARYDGGAVDQEQLYASAMLHDLGLTEQHGSHPEIACFAVEGTEAADAFLQDLNTAPDLRHTITQAVCLHLNESVDLDQYGAVAHYLQAGTLMDVIGGPRFSQIPKPLRRQVLERHPRGDMKLMMQGHVKRQMEARPHSRMALLGKMGLGKLVAIAPYDS